MLLYDILQNSMPDGWFADVRMNYGETLTDNMIVDSVQQASDFFNMDIPSRIINADSTCVFLNRSITPLDDVLGVNREQLYGMGINEQQGLDLVMTHECAHRALQGMKHMGLNSQQEELCCDFMSGVRAGLNNIDVSQLEDALAKLPAGKTHPCGADRVNAMESGVSFAHEYYKLFGQAPTFDDCLSRFKNELGTSSFTPFMKQINLRMEDAHNFNEGGETAGSIGFSDHENILKLNEGGESTGGIGFSEYENISRLNYAGETCGSIGFNECENVSNLNEGGESTGGIGFNEYESISHLSEGGETCGSIGFTDNNYDEENVKEYTKSEINRKMEEAKSKEEYYKDLVRHEQHMARYSTIPAQAQGHLDYAAVYARKANEWHDEYIKWKHTKPDK